MATLVKYKNGSLHKAKPIVSGPLDHSATKTPNELFLHLNGEATNGDHYYRLTMGSREFTQHMVYFARMMTTGWNSIREEKSAAQIMRDFADTLSDET